MRRALLLAAVAALALFGFTAAASASDPPTVDVPPAFAPPTPAPVVDTDSAGAFAKLYAARHGDDFLRDRGRHRVRVIDADAACLQSPVVDTRFGCVFTLRALVISRSHGWDGWGHDAKASRHSHGRRHHQRHFRIRTFGCLGALTIDGGPTATPSAQVRFVECGRVPRGDMVAPEPVI